MKLLTTVVFPLSLMLEVEMGVVPPGLANLYLNEHISQNQLKHNMLRLALLFLTRMVKFLITLFRCNYLLIRFFFLILLSQLACCYRILSDFVFCLCLFFLPCRRLLTADDCSSAWPESLPPPACWLRGLASFNRTPTLFINTLLWFLKPRSYRPTKQQKPPQVNALPHTAGLRQGRSKRTDLHATMSSSCSETQYQGIFSGLGNHAAKANSFIDTHIRYQWL